MEGLDLYDDAGEAFELMVAVDEGVEKQSAAGDDAHFPSPESSTGLPHPADDDRHVGPALSHHISSATAGRPDTVETRMQERPTQGRELHEIIDDRRRHSTFSMAM